MKITRTLILLSTVLLVSACCTFSNIKRHPIQIKYPINNSVLDLNLIESEEQVMVAIKNTSLKHSVDRRPEVLYTWVDPDPVSTIDKFYAFYFDEDKKLKFYSIDYEFIHTAGSSYKSDLTHANYVYEYLYNYFYNRNSKTYVEFTNGVSQYAVWAIKSNKTKDSYTIITISKYYDLYSRTYNVELEKSHGDEDDLKDLKVYMKDFKN